MLKTFNVTEKYTHILEYLSAQKNQSSFICELVSKQMQKDLQDAQETEFREIVHQDLLEIFQHEGRRIIRDEVRDLLQYELQTILSKELDRVFGNEGNAPQGFSWQNPVYNPQPNSANPIKLNVSQLSYKK